MDLADHRRLYRLRLARHLTDDLRRPWERPPAPGRLTGKGRGRWTMRWKAALNAFDIAFDGRLSAGRI
jgi:hypothetical protein